MLSTATGADAADAGTAAAYAQDKHRGGNTSEAHKQNNPPLYTEIIKEPLPITFNF